MRNFHFLEKARITKKVQSCLRAPCLEHSKKSRFPEKFRENDFTKKKSLIFFFCIRIPGSEFLLTITVSFVSWKPSSYFAQTIVVIVVYIHQGLVRAVGVGLFCGLWAVMRYRGDEAISGRVRPEKVAVGLHSEQLQCERHLAISEKY